MYNLLDVNANIKFIFLTNKKIDEQKHYDLSLVVFPLKNIETIFYTKNGVYQNGKIPVSL